MNKIEQVWVAVAVDEDGNEGVPSVRLRGTQFPLIAADGARLASITQMAQAMANATARLSKSKPSRQSGERHDENHHTAARKRRSQWESRLESGEDFDWIKAVDNFANRLLDLMISGGAQNIRDAEEIGGNARAAIIESKFDKCDHNEMVPSGIPGHVWKCAKCGHIYGQNG